MAIKFSNNGSSTLAGAISAVATSISVAATEGSRFPALGVGDWFMATLVKLVAGNEVREIIKVTARTNDALTIERAQEGTTATTFSAGDRIENRLTAAALQQYGTDIATLNTNLTTLDTHVDTEVARLDGAIAALGGSTVTLATIHAALLSF